MPEKCPYRTGKLKTCGGTLKLTMEKLLDDDPKQTQGLPETYIKQFFECTRCGRRFKRYFIWKETEYYDR